MMRPMATSTPTTTPGDPRPAGPSGPGSPATASLATTSPAQLAVIIAIGAVLANGAFFFLSKTYWEDRSRRFGPQEIDFIGSSRQHFAVFSIVVGLALVAAILKPRIVAHGIAVAASLGAFMAAYGAYHRELPGVIPASCAIIGVALPAFAYHSWRGSRAAWSALSSMVAVLAFVLMFGAPKLAAQLGGGLWTAMIMPGVLVAALSGLVHTRGRYAAP